MKIGNCVQIGIDKTAEYIFLTESDWKLKLHNADDEWQLDPNIFSDISRWNYHGVDANPHSIACAAVQYRYLERLDLNNVKWICTSIGSMESMYSVGEYGFNQPIYTPSITLSRLFALLGLDYNFELLALDIEGMEYEIFKDYDWKIKPKVIKVEMHHPLERSSERHALVRLFESHGYRLIDRITTDYHEYAKFLRD